METWEEYWTQVVSKYTPAITEDELLWLQNLHLCKTQGIIERWVLEPIQRGYYEEEIYNEYDYCGHYDQIYVKNSAISSVFLMLQYPPSICYPQDESEYSPYYFDFTDGTHMKLLVETSNNRILRYGDKVDEYDVPECTLENIYIWETGFICDYPENADEEFCADYLEEKRASEKKNSEELQTETQTPTNQWLHFFQNSFLLRISLTICVILFIICIIKILQKIKKSQE